MRKEILEKYFKDKKVTVMGLGLLGRGIGDSSFLASFCDNLIITDKKDEIALKESIQRLSEFQNITFHLGSHNLKDFENRDFILKSAGVPLDSEYTRHAIECLVPVYMSAALAVKIIKENLPNVKVIGVTGTRGKSTVTELVAHILKTANKNFFLGGNIRGDANLPILNEIEDGDFLVLELDSWQLQGFGDLKISPDISVFTNFLDDHLNYYKNDKEAYFADKANIYKYQKEQKLFVTKQAMEEISKRDGGIKAVIPESYTLEMKLIGLHNEELAGLAYGVCLECGLSEEDIRSGIKSFEPVAGRLQNIGVIRGTTVYNDNNGTTGDAVIVGIDAVIRKHNIKPIVICGGTDKGLDISKMEDALKNKTKEVIYLSGTGTDRISLPKEYEYEKLEDCVKRAFGEAKDGDVILFCPGFASFSKSFNNEYERNDEFVRVVKSFS